MASSSSASIKGLCRGLYLRSRYVQYSRLTRMKKELKLLTLNSSIPETSHIVKCFGVKKVRENNSDVFYCLLEYMNQGSLFDFMEKKQHEKFSEEECLKIFKQVCLGIRVMHHLNPPVAHRDLKIENILFDGANFKLCDFGSVSSEIVDFKNISRNDYDEKIHEFDKKTTITYRPPEMCDPYLQLKVDIKADIWMLGCILFSLAFYKHPFQECTTLSIVNASYYMPHDHNFSQNFENLIRNLLTPDPTLRYTIDELLSILDRWDTAVIQLNAQAMSVKQEQMKRQNIWNEDAWNQIGKSPINPSELAMQVKPRQQDHSQANIAEHQVRAEFSDFNVDGLMKFKNSKKYVGTNSSTNQQQDFGFGSQPVGDQNAGGFGDFLSWDPQPPKNNQKLNEFKEFDFGNVSPNQNQVNSGGNDDFFGAGPGQGQVSNTSNNQSSSANNIWDAFGQTTISSAPIQPVSSSVQNPFGNESIPSGPFRSNSNTNSSPFDDSPTRPKSTNEELLELGFEGDSKEVHDIGKDLLNPSPAPSPINQEPQKPQSHGHPLLDMELN